MTRYKVCNIYRLCLFVLEILQKARRFAMKLFIIHWSSFRFHSVICRVSSTDFTPGFLSLCCWWTQWCRSFEYSRSFGCRATMLETMCIARNMYDRTSKTRVFCFHLFFSSGRTYFGSSSSLGRLYVFGGQNFDYKALCDCEQYDVLRDKWMSGIWCCSILIIIYVPSISSVTSGWCFSWCSSVTEYSSSKYLRSDFGKQVGTVSHNSMSLMTFFGWPTFSRFNLF